MLRRVSRFAEAETKKGEVRQQRCHVHSAVQIRFLHVAHRRGGAFGEQGSDPVLVGRAKGVRAERMQMVGDRAGHELHLRPCERAGNLSVIPSGVKRNLAHRERRRKGFRLVVHHRFKTYSLDDVRRVADPVVADLVVCVREAAQIKVSPAPQPVGLCFHRLVHEATRDLHTGAIEPRDHQHAVGRVDQRRVGDAVSRIARRAIQRMPLNEQRQRGQFAVHGCLVPTHLRAHFFRAWLGQIGVIQYADRNAVAQRRVTNPGSGDLLNHVAGLVARGRNDVRTDDEQLLPFQRLEQRFLQIVVKLRAFHGLCGRQVEAEDLVGRHVAALRVVKGQFP